MSDKEYIDVLEKALKSILDHVEDLSLERNPANQCTPCHTYRMIGHDALNQAARNG